MGIREIKLKSLADMKNNYGLAILSMILLNLALLGSVTVGLIFGLILVAGAVMCSKIAFYIDIAKGGVKGIDNTYRGFKQFARAMIGNLLLLAANLIAVIASPILFGIISIFAIGEAYRAIMMTALFIALLAFAISIIVINIRLSMTFYIMNDKTELSAFQCVKSSWILTKTRTVKILLFYLSFIGWFLLCGITLGLAYLYVGPYFETAKANLYLSLAESTT